MHLDPAVLRIGALALVFLAIYGTRATKGKARETPAGLSFPLKPAVLTTRALALIFYMGFLVYLIHAQGHQIPVWFPVVLLLGIGLLLTQLPGTITLGPEAITQDFWFLKRRVIAYPEVMAIQNFSAGRAIRILGNTRITITHTGNHADSARFRTELERLTGKRIV